MHLDTSTAIGAGFASREEMRQAMVGIAEHTLDRGSQLDWANHLRFLTPRSSSVDLEQLNTPADKLEDASPLHSDSDEDSQTDCSCNYFGTEPFKRNQRTIHLTQPMDLPECVHYVAVSYCWASSAEAVYHGKPFSVSQNGKSVRAPYCPSSLLQRSIEFARYKDISLVWIDQECVDQSNILDKEVGIQSMDLVYQRAAYSLAVLETCIVEQHHLDALGHLAENSADLDDLNELQGVCEALSTIMVDPWFQRAWCLQESTSGSRQMTLLIRYGDGLEVPYLLESVVEGSFELDLWMLHDTIVSSLEYRLENWHNDADQSMRASCQKVIDDWYENMPPDVSSEFDADSRTVCNGAQALSYLKRRQNSVVTDRLAIMANLCQYDVRLDALALDGLQYNFSICAFVLAVINGDMSLVVGHEDCVQTGTVGRRIRLTPGTANSEDDESRPFSWSLPQHAALSRLSYYDHNSTPLRMEVNSTSLAQGLLVDGCFWIADHMLDLSRLAMDFKARWSAASLQPLLNIQSYERPYIHDEEGEGVQADFLLRLLCEFAERGFKQLVRLLWEWFRLQPLAKELEDSEEISRYERATFEDVIDVAQRSVKWPNPIWAGRSSSKVHPFQTLTQFAFRHMMETILLRGEMLVARPKGMDIGHESYGAIFDVADLDTIVFTPRLNGDLRTAENYAWYPNNWIVDGLHDKIGDDPVETSCRSLVSGLWQGDEHLARQTRLK